jgi:hypothetical protein
MQSPLELPAGVFTMNLQAYISAHPPHATSTALWRASLLAAIVGAWGTAAAQGQQTVTISDKYIIGATATLTEASSGISFSARIDTGAKTCSLHVEQMEIDDESPQRLRNIGKEIRFLIKGDDGKTAWIEGTIAAAVRVRSSALKNGEFDQRYKVKLPLQWKDVRKEVLVTLTDRTDMVYPLLVGRNFLRGDFLVDVSKTDDES